MAPRGLKGFVAIVAAAAHTKHPDPDPGLAHLSGLFVRPAHQGTGLASDLLARAHREAHARGFTAGLLFCAAGYVRARRFYEREGWRAVGEPFAEPAYNGLDLIEYRLAGGGEREGAARPSGTPGAATTSPRPPSS